MTRTASSRPSRYSAARPTPFSNREIRVNEALDLSEQPGPLQCDAAALTI